VRHILYEDPLTHKFALIRLPAKHVDGERMPIPLAARWFSTRQEALATLSELFDCEDGRDEGSIH